MSTTSLPNPQLTLNENMPNEVIPDRHTPDALPSPVATAADGERALRAAINEIADQLCRTVDGDFDLTIYPTHEGEEIEKLGMLINFVLDAARRHLADLHARNIELAEIDRRKTESLVNLNQDIQDSELRYRSLVVATAQIVWTRDADGKVKDMPDWRIFTGQSVEQVVGFGWLAAIHPDDREPTERAWKRAVRTGEMYETEYRLRRHDGVYRRFAARGVPIVEDNGTIREWVGTCTDVTERRNAEEARAHLQEQLIATQAARLEELQTPLIPLSRNVVLMPLVGTLDAERAANMLRTISEGISVGAARVAIIDVTGVTNFDTHAVSTLVQAAQSAHLLGAQVILTGIRTRVAQTLVALGIDLAQVVTRSTLERGIAYADECLAESPAAPPRQRLTP